jgi:hypothetical protein
MSLTSALIGIAERVPLPDVVIRTAIERLCARTAAVLSGQGTGAPADFAGATACRRIAEYTDKANSQHYELPAAFFGHVLGPKRKYSCCYYPTPDFTLEQAETKALQETTSHARLNDGQSILEHGCGRFDRNRCAIETIFHSVYGSETERWMRRWRWFFLATAGLFGFAGGSEWGVSHFRLKPISAGSA